LLAVLVCALSIVEGMPNSVHAQTTQLTVETDAQSYHLSETIKVTGHLITSVIDQPLLIVVRDPQGHPDRVDQFNATADGSYTYSFTAGGLMNTSGTYRIIVTYRGTTSAETTFAFDAIGSEWQTIQAIIGDQGYPVQYTITGTGNRLVNLTGNVGSISLAATLSTESGGTLSLRFSPQIFDADNEFIASADGAPLPVNERRTDSANEIDIEFEAGTKEIDILGDRIIPEFGIYGATVMVIGIIGVVALFKTSVLLKD